MSDVLIRQEGRSGRVTLNRPDALNALTWDMCREIESALDQWRENEDVSLVMFDATSDKAFCAGGDLVEMYRQGQVGNAEYGRNFWTDEYRLNAKIAEYPKPCVAFLQGFVMGGGVGVGCHCSHRIVCASTRIAMPECAVGLIPDVGGTFLLSRAPGRLGEYLAVTGTRMTASDAILATFADTYIPEESWNALKAALVETGEVQCIKEGAVDPGQSELGTKEEWVLEHFRGNTLGDVVRSLSVDTSDLAAETLTAISRQSPLSATCAYEALGRVRGAETIRRGLEMEYRFTYRSFEHSDFLEGIRAIIIDKDRSPKWRHSKVEDVPRSEVTKMLMPLGADKLNLEEPAA